MRHTIIKALLVAQLLLAAAVILTGAAFSLRCLEAGNPFAALCFALMAYIAGYRLLLTASLREWHTFNTSKRTAQ